MTSKRNNVLRGRNHRNVQEDEEEGEEEKDSSSSSFLLFLPPPPFVKFYDDTILFFGYVVIVSDYVISTPPPNDATILFLDYDVVVSDDVSPSGVFRNFRRILYMRSRQYPITLSAQITEIDCPAEKGPKHPYHTIYVCSGSLLAVSKTNKTLVYRRKTNVF